MFTLIPTRAFTLIEVIIYLTLFSILMSGILVSVYPLLSHSERLTTHVLRESEVAFITEKIRNALHHTVTDSTVVVTEPPEGGTGNILRITKGGVELLALHVDESLTFCSPPRVCSMLVWSDNENAPLPLNNERIAIDSFVVTHTPPTTNTERSLEISFTADGVPMGPFIYHMHF